MVSGKRAAALSASITIRQHELTTGVSEKLGGQDEGPNPHELFEAALVGCTVITVQMYANRKGWKLDSTNVSVRILSEGKEGAHILREVSFVGDLTDEQNQKLLEIANKCPIHELMSRDIKVETQLVSAVGLSGEAS